MFSFLKKKPKKRSIPPMPDEVLAIGGETTEWCKQQIGQLLEGPPRSLPNYGTLHDIRVASYVCGFTSGQFLINGLLADWSNGEEGLEYWGYSAICTVSLSSVLGFDRSLEVVKHLPQMIPGLEYKDDVLLLERWGGTDGMSHARGQSKQKDGALLHYLKNNVAAS